MSWNPVLDDEKKSLIYEKYFTSSTTNDAKTANGNFSWEGFKKQYYALESKIKKQMDRFNQILSEITKQTSNFDIESSAGEKSNNGVNLQVYENWQREYQAVSINLRNLLGDLGDHIASAHIDANDNQGFVKKNMLQRFREIHNEHEKEYRRLLQTMEFNFKKYELLKETLKVGGTNGTTANGVPGGSMEVNKRVNQLAKEGQDITRSLHMADDILSQAKAVTTSFVNQKMKLTGIATKVSQLKENMLPGVNKLIADIKKAKNRRMVIYLGLIICVLVMIMILSYIRSH